jgi:predicted nucleic acid-binding protein
LILYLDTSLLVAAFTNEAATERVQDWLGAQPVESLTISDWVTTEFSAALSIKLRNRELDVSHRADALALFARLSADSFTILPVARAQFLTAARFADQHAIGLRAGDALHLAICADRGATIYTLDRRLAEAAPLVGVQAVLL